MAKNNDGILVNDFSNGIYTDCNPVDQPKGTYRFALNAIEESKDGNQRKLSNEPSNFDVSTIPAGFLPCGDKYIGDNTTVLMLVNPTTDKQQIGLVNKDNKYSVHVETAVLGFKITNQCDIVYRLRRGNERVIYWVDGLGFAKTYNFDKPYNFYRSQYKDYISNGGNPDTYVGEKWDENSFNLIKTYKSIPFFSNVEIVETGSILPGSYNFAIQLVDEDLNPTEWITTSNTVNIYNDSINSPFHTIRGSRNVDNSAQSFSRANKSIKLTITNLDISFPYYRVGIIRASAGTGAPDKVLASELYSTSNSNFTYAGNDAALKEVAIEDILIDQEVIYAPRHIEQIENRLLLMHTQGKQLNLCDFQKFASKIKTDLVTKEVLLNNIQSEPNVKAAKSTFVYGGYMPGEAYSFGVVYVFPDYLTPSYHIVGKNILDTNSKMLYHEIDGKYLDIHNCSTDNYWGYDAKNQTLVGKKIRHHRFPFRKDVNKPLVTTDSTVTNITKYRLKLTFTLNPAWTPGPPSYPVSGTGAPLVIGYTINYKVTGSSTNNNFNSQLVDTDVTTPIQITIYDDSLPLSFVVGSSYYEIDPTSELATYITGTNDRFIVTPVYESYTLSSSIDNDKAQIFGITFSNIEKPHPDCIGFYIVRNDRTDDDKLIVDNAIFGVMTQFEQYKSFGLLMPKQYYASNNCGRTGVPNKTVSYFDKSIWFFNPEFEYFQKKTEFDSVVIEGTYSETSVNMPTVSNMPNSICNVGNSKGVYIQDVQAGTSYNPEINKSKDKDDDGFDLIIGYRNTNVSFSLNTTGITLPVKIKILYLNAASYQNFNSNTYYNVSVDNKIGMYLTQNSITLSAFRDTVNNKNNLLYGAMVKNNPNAYSNFLTKPYYKEHNNPILFPDNVNIINNVEIYNGDADISAMHLVSSIFYDMVVANRPKKSSIWKIIVGAVLVVAAIVATVATGGLAAPLAVVAASSLAVSYGVALLASGIKFEQFKSMIDVDYEKGLKDTVTDGGVFETIRENLSTEDDTIRWFADRVSNIYMESSVPFGLRSGLTSGVPDFMDAPYHYDENQFRTYLTEKLTAIDRDQGSGRVYKGYASAEVYDMNKDYMRFNREKLFIHLPLEYDCCSSNREIYPTRRWYSEQSFQEEKTDNYAVFLPNSYSDMEGEHGEITDAFRLGNVIYIHTREAVWIQPANLQERVTNEIVTFIGTGAFLSIPPRKVVDDSLSSAGTRHKWATLKTSFGVFFISEIEGRPYLLGEKPVEISTGNTDYFRENIKSFLSEQLYNKFGVDFKHDNNPANPNGIGYISNFDTRFERIVFTKRDYLIVTAKLDIITLKTVRPLTGVGFSYCLEDGRFYEGIVPLDLSNSIYFEDKGFTMSFSIKSKKWVSWHSYRPIYYIHNQNNFYSYIAGVNKIYKHHKDGSYGRFYDNGYAFILEYILTSKSLADSVFTDISLQTIARKWDDTTKQYFDERFVTFNKITVSNNKQCTGELVMVVKDTQANPENWYQQQVINNSDILITKKGNNWNVNNFRNFVNDYTKPIFSKAWNDIKTNYFIDKIVNAIVLDYNKNWYELESLTGKFVSIRLKFDTFDNVNLIVDYTVEFEEPSFR
jgi:hypothetical protein